LIIHTHNEAVAALVAPYGLRMPSDDQAFVMAPATVQQLDRLCTILTTDHAGQWSVSFDGGDEDRHYEYLARYLSYPNWIAMLQICSNIGAAGKLTLWLEDVYRMPVDDTNWQRVAQLFRFWYAATHPDEYVNPPDAIPAKYAKLQLAHPAGNKAKQARRNQRRINAVTRIGYDTLDTFAAAVLALSPEDAEKVKAILRKS
jgi:hypothetical protein